VGARQGDCDTVRGLRPSGLTTSGASRASRRPTAPVSAGRRPAALRAASPASMTRPDDSVTDKSGTIGQPMPHTEVKIIDPDTGATLPVGQVGEYCTRGYHVMHGCFDNPEATAAAIDADGWLHTGDLCAMDSRGYCTVEGRLKDMIIRGGENIYPRELEELLFKHPVVGEVAVVGIPDAKWGEQVVAFGPNRGRPSTRRHSSPTWADAWRRTRRRGTGSCSKPFR